MDRFFFLQWPKKQVEFYVQQIIQLGSFKNNETPLFAFFQSI